MKGGEPDLKAVSKVFGPDLVGWKMKYRVATLNLTLSDLDIQGPTFIHYTEQNEVLLEGDGSYKGFHIFHD